MSCNSPAAAASSFVRASSTIRSACSGRSARAPLSRRKVCQFSRSFTVRRRESGRSTSTAGWQTRTPWADRALSPVSFENASRNFLKSTTCSFRPEKNSSTNRVTASLSHHFESSGETPHAVNPYTRGPNRCPRALGRLAQPGLGDARTAGDGDLLRRVPP
jgi:hypothetical protein